MNNRSRKKYRYLGIKKSDLWDLDQTIISYVLPRLKAFKKYNEFSIPYGYVEKPDEWHNDIQKVIDGFELYMKDEYWYVDNPTRDEDAKKVQEAREIFGRILYDLWD